MFCIGLTVNENQKWKEYIQFSFNFQPRAAIASLFAFDIVNWVKHKTAASEK